MQNIRVFTVYHFFWFDTRILVKLSRYTSWLFFGVWIVVVMVGRSNIDIEAMEIIMILLEDLAYYTRLHCVTVNLIFFALYFVYIASNFKELLVTRSHLIIFLYLLSQWRKKTNKLKSFDQFSFETICILRSIQFFV